MLISPGTAPPTLAHTSRTARPIVALARQPGPKTPAPQLTSSAVRIGPLTMTSERDGVGGPGHADQGEGRVADGLDRRDHRGHVLRPAAGHHGVDGDLLDGGPAQARRDLADQLVAVAAAGPHGGLHARERSAAPPAARRSRRARREPRSRRRLPRSADLTTTPRHTPSGALSRTDAGPGATPLG